MANGAAVAAKAAAQGRPTVSPDPPLRQVPGPDLVPPQLKPGELPEIEPGAPLSRRLAIGAAQMMNLFDSMTSEFIVCATCSIQQKEMMRLYGGSKQD